MRVFDIGDDYVDFLHDESRREGRADKIAFPVSTEDVREALQTAAENGWPITVQGGRTGITGGCVPDDGLILNLSRMNAIGEITGHRMTVQSGAVLADIRCALADSDFFFPSDLTETSATIGGMISNNASGARSFRYGSVRSWIQGLTVVLPNGEVVALERGMDRAAGRAYKVGGVEGELPELTMPAVKTAAGYYVMPDMDLVDLFIGAEGTLGIITEATLQLLPRQNAVYGLTAFFSDEEQAVRFVHFLRKFSKPLAIEFFDARALNLLRRMSEENAAFADIPALKPEFHTAIYFEFENKVPELIVERVEEAVECWMAEGDHEIGALKNFRHAIPESVNLLISERKKSIPELTKLGTDMSVPDGRLEDVMRMYHNGLDEAGLEYVIFGHIGSNHLHVNILPRSLEEYEKGRALYLEWAGKIVVMGGSVSAEHGIGKMKIEFLRLLFGDEGIQRMRQLRDQFDPAGLLNRGNLFNRDR